MKINGLQPQDVYKSYMKSTVSTDGADKSDSNISQTDRVEISSQASDINDARDLVKKSGILNESDSDAAARAERIEKLKNQIQTGTYSVNSKDVSQSIIKGRYLDKTV